MTSSGRILLFDWKARTATELTSAYPVKLEGFTDELIPFMPHPQRLGRNRHTREVSVSRNRRDPLLHTGPTDSQCTLPRNLKSMGRDFRRTGTKKYPDQNSRRNNPQKVIL